MNRYRLRWLVGPLATLVLVANGLLAGPAVAAQVNILCTPNQVRVFNERLDVRCDESFGGIVFFVTSTADAASANRILSVIQTALLAGRTLVVLFDPNDLSGAAFGCQTNDCRLILGIGFGK